MASGAATARKPLVRVVFMVCSFGLVVDCMGGAYEVAGGASFRVVTLGVVSSLTCARV
jgi:hypothetical protein